MDKYFGMTYQCTNNSPDFSFISVSEGCLELLGYTADELTAAGGPTLTKITHPDDAASLINLHNATLCTGLSLETGFRIKTKDGTEKQIWLRCKVTEMDDRGMPAIFEGLCTDVTNLLRLETSKIINRGKVGFLSTLSHEIRTPMNCIIGMAELGLREEMSDRLRNCTSSIKSAGEKLMDSLTAIEDFGKIETDELRLFPEEYRLSSVIKTVTDITLELVKDKPLEFWVYADSKLPDLLVGDALRLQQMMLNLLSNAVKFSDSGIVTLTIEGETGGGKVDLQITVNDMGRGIKEEHLGDVFTAYAQFDNKSIEGLGLGLTIARSLAGLMGGEINVSSVYGLGSVASFTVPQDISGEGVLCEIPDTHRLLIYDNRATRGEFISKTLDNLGLSHKLVSTDSEFLECLENYAPVFVAKELREAFGKHPVFQHSKIMDISMPLYCLPIAELLNSDKPQIENTVSFIAPEARVLVVDDVKANLLVMEGLLEPYKMRLDLFTTAEEAIAAVQVSSYDLILMDHLMPAMDGVEATAYIRGLSGYPTDCKNVPIIAVTASAMPGLREMFLNSGFNAFVSKPVDIRMLNAAIAKWIPASKQTAVAAPSEEQPAPKADFELRSVDVQKGIELCGGNKDIYLEILEVYYEGALKLRDLLRECLDTGDINLYRIHVHALKSSSGNISADNVCKMASTLESAAERNDMEFIQTASQELFSALDVLLSDISVLTKNRNVPSVDVSNLEPTLIMLKAALINRDAAGIIEHSDALQIYLPKHGVGEIINRILQNIKTCDFEEAVLLVDTLL